MQMNYLMGADPEVFVMADKHFVNGHGLIPGTKEAPHRVSKGAIQVDGMALEFNIDPASTRQEFIDNIKEVTAALREQVEGRYELVPAPVAHFTDEYMRLQPLESLMLGCDPDFDAWEKRMNEPPIPNEPIRTGAGHIHLGWTEGVDDVFKDSHIDKCVDIIRHLDCTLGLASVILDPNKKRRSLYGKAGAFRPKPYGVEYRVLSNFWLTTPVLTQWVYEATNWAMQHFDNGSIRNNKEVVDIINSSDVSKAEALLPRDMPMIREGVLLNAS